MPFVSVKETIGCQFIHVHADDIGGNEGGAHISRYAHRRQCISGAMPAGGWVEVVS